MRILLAEDEKALSRAMIKIFEKNHYTADAVYNGVDALHYLESGYYDVAVLDIMMPKMDGITVLKTIRAKGNQIPILMLTARSGIEDRVAGLDSGANDYLPKPFDTGELLARIRAMLRRKEDFAPSNLSCGNLTLDRSSYELSTPGHDKLHLSSREFQMMEMLMTSPGRVISVDSFMDRIWADGEADVNVVWVYISNLRKKLTSLEASCEIKASRGVGYSIAEK